MEDRTERELEMLKVLAAMVDGYNALKFYINHIEAVKNGSCISCEAAATIAVMDGLSTLDTPEGFKKFDDNVCDEMRVATYQVNKAEKIARTVRRSLELVEERVKHETKE